MNLVLDAVCKRFGDRNHGPLVLDRISLAMHTGQFLALLGSSGSGKSTLMRLVAGLEQPSSGSISLPLSGSFRLSLNPPPSAGDLVSWNGSPLQPVKGQPGQFSSPADAARP
jgi:ABC-type histidine transport system ATPase subunit